MEFGIGFFGDLTYNQTTQEFQKPAERLKQIVEQIQLADELGIDVLTMGEHHRPDYAVSSPEIMLAALATVTKRIKLASGVSVVSSSITSSTLSMGRPMGLATVRWARLPIMVSRNALSKPVMTLITTMRAVTPTLTPAMEIMVMRLMKRVRRFPRKYRAATKLSKRTAEIFLNIEEEFFEGAIRQAVHPPLISF